MTDFFKSAFGIFGNNNSSTNNPAGIAGPASISANNYNIGSHNQSNDFVGQTILISNYKLKITKLLAEGKYS
jgi:hypothetical protein